MRVLVLGGGGREHCLVWKLARSASVEKIWCTPGNAGIASDAECVDMDIRDHSGIIELVRSNKIDLVVPGPEQPLVEGIVDVLTEQGIKVFGPTRRAARLEASKSFAKNLMTRHGIPTARFDVFTSPKDALKFAENIGFPVVIKADGLAAGKGAVICADIEEAQKTITEMMIESRLGEAGERVVIEEFLEGAEMSVLAIVSGSDILTLPCSQDHKQVFDGDKGPNTGGMGAYAPYPHLTTSEFEQIERDVIIQTVHAMAQEGVPYNGVLYAGIMLTAKGPHVLEFNCRFGDPETQAVLPLLKGDLGELLMASVEGRLADVAEAMQWDNRCSVCVVMASEGYPGNYRKGARIEGLDKLLPQDVMVFHAGTKKSKGKDGEYLTTAGGRVLGITALGANLTEARARAYSTVNSISFNGAQFRTDIGRRERKI